MAKPTIGNLRSLPDFLQTTRWDMQVASNVAGMPDIQGVNVRCQSSSIPTLNGKSNVIAIRGQKVKQTGQYDYDMKIQLTMVETIDMFVSDWMKQWRELCWETGNGKQHYKKDVTADIVLYRLDGMDVQVWQYTLFGCFMEEYDGGETMDGEEGKVVQPKITLGYDYFEDKKL